MVRRTWIVVVCFFVFASSVPAGAPVDFARDIAPIFAENCLRCHGPKKHEGGLRLDVRRRALQGGDTGPAIVGKDLSKSELWRRITSAKDDERMPPSGPPLSAQQQARLRLWIEQGAIWPDAHAGKESYQDHWAFRTIGAPSVPTVQHRQLVRNPIDAFILARLEAKGLTLAPPAARTTLIRRLFLDLLGLPPTPDEVAAFGADPREDAYERLVERLLASPHFGERWGRHWLDLARFAESDGYENDNLRPNAWRWRDWVIDAMNRDLPFDQFTIQQLAGDLLPAATMQDKVATGLHRNTLWNSAASGDKEEFRTRAVKDRAETTGTAWLGLTLACAGCHSHKYDPIAQREYYQLYAFFNDTDHQEIDVPGGKAPALRAVKRASFVHVRGNFLSKGAAVEPGTPAFLPPIRKDDGGRMKDEKSKPAALGSSFILHSSSFRLDRLDLARWLIDPRHPLTARVAVNHLWQHLFGQGLVTTPENFGLNGQPPSHPELLDWLAHEFVGRGWSRKALLRTIVTSSTYRQDSSLRDDLTKLDAGNTLLGRQNRFRVDAEIVRDLALSVSGLLDRKVGGPSVVPPYPEGFLAQRFTNESLKMPTQDHRRRGIYIHVQRTLTHPMLAAFDAADGNQPCPRRDRSTTPVQALTLLNDPVFIESAQALGKLIRMEPAQSTDDAGREQRLRRAFQLCLARLPSERELAVLIELIDAQRKLGANEEAIWTGIARTLLNLEEFITRE